MSYLWELIMGPEEEIQPTERQAYLRHLMHIQIRLSKIKLNRVVSFSDNSTIIPSPFLGFGALTNSKHKKKHKK